MVAETATEKPAKPSHESLAGVLQHAGDCGPAPDVSHRAGRLLAGLAFRVLATTAIVAGAVGVIFWWIVDHLAMTRNLPQQSAASEAHWSAVLVPKGACPVRATAPPSPQPGRGRRRTRAWHSTPMLRP